MESAWPFVLGCRDLWFVRASSGKGIAVGVIAPSELDHEEHSYDQPDTDLGKHERSAARLDLRISCREGRQPLSIVALRSAAS